MNRHCGWNRTFRDDGFSLLETVLAISLAAVTSATGMDLLHSEQHISVQTQTVVEGVFQRDSLARGMSQDVHAAVHCTADLAHQQLVLDEVGGTTFMYRLNGVGQIVRIGNNGGTSVMASGIRSWVVDAKDQWVEVSITDQSGAQWRFDWTSLAGVM